MSGLTPSSPAAEPPPPKSTFDESTFENITLTDLPHWGREPWAARWAGKIGRHQVALAILTILALWAILTVPLWQSNQYRVGKAVENNVIASHSQLLIDEGITNAKRREAASLVPPVYDGQPEAGQQALDELHSLRKAADEPPGNATSLTRRWGDITTASPQTLSPLADTIAVLPAETRRQVFRLAAEAVRAAYQQEQIRSDVPEDLHVARRHIENFITASSSTLNANHKKLAATLARLTAHRPNLLLNQGQTERARRNAEAEVHPMYQQIQAGDVVIAAGTVLTSAGLQKLQALGIAASPPDLLTAGINLTLCLILVLMCGAFLAVVHRPLLREPTWLWLTAVVPIVMLVLLRLALQAPHGDWMLAPLAAVAAMVLAILFDARAGIMAGFLVAACGTLLASATVGLFLAALLAAWIGALAMADITSRGQLVRAALLLAAVQAVLTLSFAYLQHLPSTQFMSLIMWSIFSGIGAAFVATALAMLLERPFGITTHLRLLDLISPQEGILLRMQTEAPGTYTHSLMVSILSENAAKKVGANSLLCRVAGLYHDIGKLRRPHCFIENQTGQNVHDRLSPQLSARIILAHVRDGLVLGKALRLPTPVLDIIAQHHGKSLIAYFYHRALNDSDIALESHFRYPGPLPQSKEAALIMLADTVEASSRTLADITPERLRAHVQEIISTRLREGELSQCDLTLRDLSKIEDSFVLVLRGALHHRIEYPGPGQSLERANDSQWVREALADGFNEQHPREHHQKQRHLRQERKLHRKRQQEHLLRNHETVNSSSQDLR